MIVNPENLRKMTAKAVANGQRLHEEEERRQQIKEQNKKEKDFLIAQSILIAVPSKCEQAASEGESSAIVMELKYNRDYDCTHAHNHNESLTLCGPGKIVFDECVASQLNPRVESWHDGVGVSSGYNIVVSW